MHGVEAAELLPAAGSPTRPRPAPVNTSGARRDSDEALLQSPGALSRAEGRGSGTSSSAPSPAAGATRRPGLQQEPAVAGIEALVRRGIAAGRQPQLAAEGSSGTYFCYDTGGAPVAVFKPKSEEPYGVHNPRWRKRVQRTLCPCCFGRSCLVPNTGYLCEASAFVVDSALGLGVVPPTGVARLASPSFHYGRWDRSLRRVGRVLPSKIGSLQMFCSGYQSSGEAMERVAQLGEAAAAAFHAQFERLCALDYIIRNTDRGADNWLVRIDHPAEGEPHGVCSVRIAAIDNGLAFPFKHPDNWRSYPYSWLSLPAAERPFSAELREALLPRLCDPQWVESTVERLRAVWRLDRRYRRYRFAQQMNVLRGQLHNLAEALRDGDSPAQLCERPLCVVQPGRQMQSPGGTRKTKSWRRRLVDARPWFSCC
eukprot:TRINITY_DN50745_c0_g1_i1.p1 TRINITY_DN50745_c0_g1~~TRINITY_DN50745_c0_g1_i1.p1  ORF type:complete len:425 (+),score=114.74 TRINITY_DN50745_c0_g1_i1:117-1391(+)